MKRLLPVALEGSSKAVKTPAEKSNRWERLIRFYGLYLHG